MLKISTFITKKQSDYLKKLQADTGISPSESIRRALDAYIVKTKRTNKGDNNEN